MPKCRNCKQFHYLLFSSMGECDPKGKIEGNSKICEHFESREITMTVCNESLQDDETEE